MRKNKTALIIIDMQRDFLDPQGYAATAGLQVVNLRKVIAPVQRLLKYARALDVLVIHTREGHLADLSDCPAAKLERSRMAGAEIGSYGPMGRLLIRGEPGHDIIDELRPLLCEPIVDKPGYGAFYQTDLEKILQSHDIQHLIICGVTTEVCVHSTLREAVDRGYSCQLVADACGSAYPELHEAALKMIAVEGGIFGKVIDTHAVISALKHTRLEAVT